jgi:hypothetical protein
MVKVLLPYLKRLRNTIGHSAHRQFISPSGTTPDGMDKAELAAWTSIARVLLFARNDYENYVG